MMAINCMGGTVIKFNVTVISIAFIYTNITKAIYNIMWTFQIKLTNVHSQQPSQWLLQPGSVDPSFVY